LRRFLLENGIMLSWRMLRKAGESKGFDDADNGFFLELSCRNAYATAGRIL